MLWHGVCPSVFTIELSEETSKALHFCLPATSMAVLVSISPDYSPYVSMAR